ncbi:hypothetical protein [Agrobacterium sp. NPDC089420]|uniref:hypothetical protein n=1 Tax=Agrobacterium sp. NPDC089420 TaxID=3363918 RepID=UPI0038510E94
MTDISGLPGSAVQDNEPNTPQTLLSLAVPPLAPDDAAFAAADSNDILPDPVDIRPDRSFPKASWLDAMPPEAFETAPGEADHISSVNSDENGLYRMFLGVSP